MLVRCPECLAKARIAASEQITNNTRTLYCQCLSLNCSATFNASLTFEEIIRSPKQGSSKVLFTQQSDLAKQPGKSGSLGCEARMA
ncbi:ogr/Delta-like zinc finger family protein [Psychromonas aquimarina]|uniref:ogr/Delta-like zinc finger family protein n=1 Tax=Psychromonas aquimarina TaxID=444919 RepID=UPI00041A312D|nr:ogr/Delta-like zinc finger family protein [Psychromonas aquimarina]